MTKKPGALFGMVAQGPAILARAVRGRVLLRYHGELCLSLTAVPAVPTVVALLLGDWSFALACGLATALLAGAGAGLSRIKAPQEIQANEGLVVIALAFLVTAILMTWPFVVAGLAPLDAFFHAVSGITTTGLATLASTEALEPSVLFAQAWLQWYGGLVIVVLAAAIILEPGTAAKHLAGSETGQGDFVSGTRARARSMLVTYVILTALAFLAAWSLGAPAFDALLHVLAGVSTGGFSTHDDSLAGIASGPARAAIVVFSLAGAVSFSLYHGFYRRKWRKGIAWAFRDKSLITLLLLCFLTSVLLFVSAALSAPGDWGQRLVDLPLLAISAQSTTGYSSIDVAELDPASKLILIGSMAIGGDAGSTAGGIKVFRILVLLFLVRLVLLRTSLPRRAVTPTIVAQEKISESELQTTVGIVALFFIVILMSWLVFILHGAPPLDALFEVVSAVATTGLSAGLVGPDLAPVLKIVLCADMLMGRLEIVAILILCYPHTWFAGKGGSR